MQSRLPRVARALSLYFPLLLAIVLGGCVSTPAPVVTPKADLSASPMMTAPAHNPAGPSPSPGATPPNTSGWTSTIIQGSPTPIPSPSDSAISPSASLTGPQKARTDLPERFDNKADRLVKDACSNPKGEWADGWWVVMVGGRAPESKKSEDWKYFGLLVDPVCFKPSGGPSITNPVGELHWMRLSDDIQLRCAEGLTPCAFGLFRRSYPAYPPSKVPLGERNWPVVAIRMNAGQIDRVEEIVMPGDQPRAAQPAPQAPGLNPADPLAQPGGQPPGTLGSGG